MTDFIAAQADLILPELVGGYAPEYVMSFESCQTETKNTQNTKTEKRVLDTISIITLGDVHPIVVSTIVDRVKQFYGIVPKIEKSVPLTDDLLTKSKMRYEATKILKKFNSNKNILIITEKDIATTNKACNIDEWGIMELDFDRVKPVLFQRFVLRRMPTKL